MVLNREKKQNHSGNIGLITLLDDNFVIGLEVFFKSLMIHNKLWFDLPFIVLDLGLSSWNKRKIKNIYPNVEFRPIKKDRYSAVNFSATQPRLKNTYYTLDVFIQDDFDKLVFIDMDTLVLGDIRELFHNHYDIAGVKAYSPRQDKLRIDINTGVFCVSKKYLNEKTYADMLNLATPGHSMPDQHVINDFFKGKMEYFNKAYNVEKRMINSENFRDTLTKIKILHFVADKPWQKHREPGFEKFEKLWKEYYDLN